MYPEFATKGNLESSKSFLSRVMNAFVSYDCFIQTEFNYSNSFTKSESEAVVVFIHLKFVPEVDCV